MIICKTDGPSLKFKIKVWVEGQIPEAKQCNALVLK